MNRKTFLFLAIFTAALLPATATAAVIINDPILVSTNQNNAVVYLTNGPGYSTAQSMGFMYSNNAASGANVTLDLNYTHHGEVTITNALEIVNNAASNVEVWLNGTLPTYITLYYSSPLATGSDLGTPIVSETSFTISSHSELYISIVIDTLTTTGTPGSTTLTMQYTES